MQSSGPVTRVGAQLIVIAARHGRTAWNAERRFLGRTDLPLDATGRLQAEAFGERWRGAVSAVVCSPLRRAIETAATLGSPQIDPGWAEVSHGALEGLEVDAGRSRFPEVFAQWASQPDVVRLPGGESLGEARDRAWEALQRLTAREGTIALVSHQLVLAAIRCTLLERPLRDWRQFAVEPTVATVWWYDGRRWHADVSEGSNGD
jgi:probable phosphoglycerate mutase